MSRVSKYNMNMSGCITGSISLLMRNVYYWFNTFPGERRTCDMILELVNVYVAIHDMQL